MSLLNADASIEGDGAQGTLGGALAYMGDLYDDGYDDLLVSDAQLQVDLDEDHVTEGSAYLFYGPIVGTFGMDDADAQYLAPGDGSGTNHFGTSLRNGGDLSGDGVNDIIVSDGYISVSVFQGGELGVSIEGDEIGASVAWSEDYTGFSMQGATDWTGDGVSDLRLEGPYFTPTSESMFASCVLFDGPLEGLFDINDADAAVLSTSDNTWSGSDLSTDVNFDGYPDMLLGW